MLKPEQDYRPERHKKKVCKSEMDLNEQMVYGFFFHYLNDSLVAILNSSA